MEHRGSYEPERPSRAVDRRIVWRMPVPLSRREVLQRCAALGLLVAGPSFAGPLADAFADAERGTRLPTPSNELGPFYRRGAPATNDLRGATDPGLPLLVAGAVFDTRGDARPDATVEVWQADHLGHYDIEGYRYRATIATDAKGGYQFTSVMPGHYPGSCRATRALHGESAWMQAVGHAVVLRHRPRLPW